jgi:hypothetical protein
MRRGEALAALRAPPPEHKAAGLRAHSHAEAVSLGAPAIIWLKSPLHNDTPLDKSLNRKE